MLTGPAVRLALTNRSRALLKGSLLSEAIRIPPRLRLTVFVTLKWLFSW